MNMRCKIFLETSREPDKSFPDGLLIELKNDKGFREADELQTNNHYWPYLDYEVLFANIMRIDGAIYLCITIH